MEIIYFHPSQNSQSNFMRDFLGNFTMHQFSIFFGFKLGRDPPGTLWGQIQTNNWQFSAIFKRKPSGQPTDLFRNIFCQPPLRNVSLLGSQHIVSENILPTPTKQFSIFFVGAQALQASKILCLKILWSNFLIISRYQNFKRHSAEICQPLGPPVSVPLPKRNLFCQISILSQFPGNFQT